MRAKMAITLLAIGGLVLIMLYVGRSRPVLYAYREPGDPRGEPSWSILNPFRDRAPERRAELVLDELRRGEYDPLLAALSESAALKADIRAKEMEHRITAWKLVGRQDSPEKVRLFYRSARNQSQRLDSPVWVTVKPTPEGWKVIGFESWY